MTDRFFENNRKRLFEALGKDFEFSIKSGSTDFDWLTGYGRFEDIVYSAVSHGGEIEQALYIPKTDPMKERWFGRMLHADEVRGIPVKDREEFTGEAKGHEIIAHLRAFKQEEEIETLKKSIALTGEGIKALCGAIKPGAYEYNLRAAFEKVIADAGWREPCFATIVAAGANSLCLHYHECEKQIKEGEIILMDLGARVEYNGADISRTIPANEEQRGMVQLSTDCIDYVCEKAEPGMTIKQLNEIQDEYLSRYLKGDVTNYRWHSISHHLGFDCHDTCGRDEPVAEGSVFTLEVGIYFEDKGWGVRTEDDVLMTADKAVNLSKDIIPRLIKI